MGGTFSGDPRCHALATIITGTSGETAMDHTMTPSRRAVLLGAAASTMLPVPRAQAQAASVLNIATSGDPGPLDPMPVTSDLLSEITQLFYETLYIFGPDYGIAPLLASELPDLDR